MNYSDYRFTLDIQIHQAQVSVPVTLNDTARKLYIGLTDGRKPYTINDGCRAVFAAKKPDGTTILNDCLIEKNTTIVYEFSKNTTNAEGIVNCEVRLYDAVGKELTSPQFLIVVDAKVVRDEEITISESEATAISNILATERARDNAENARVQAESSRVTAEKLRAAAENLRESSEESRGAAEGYRASAENNRVSAEVARNNAENSRVAAETARVQAEADRIAADSKRIGEIDEAVDEILYLQEQIIENKPEEVSIVAYPVGAIYLSLNHTDPAALFGGTWEKLEGRYLVGSGDGLVAGDRVGEWSVKLTRENLPPETIARVSNMTLTDKTVWSMTADNKTVSKGYNGTDASGVTSRYPGGDAYIELGSNAYKTLSENNTAFSQEAITIMPPSIAVHMWRRIA